MRLVTALAIATVALSVARPTAAKGGPTQISGPGIETPIRVAFVDELAFWAGLGPRPVEVTGSPDGPAYTVDSDYWGTIVPATWAGQTPPTQGSQPEDLQALYFVDAGLVRMSRGGQFVWLRLDERRQALLRRYVDLGRRGLLPPQPSIFDVLLSAREAGEDIHVAVAGQTLGAESEALWQAVKDGKNLPGHAQPVSRFASRTPIDFQLPEGRSVRLWLVPSLGLLVDLSSVQQANNYELPAPNVGLPPAMVTALGRLADSQPGAADAGLVSRGPDGPRDGLYAAIGAMAAALALVAGLGGVWLRKRARRASTDPA